MDCLYKLLAEYTAVTFREIVYQILGFLCTRQSPSNLTMISKVFEEGKSGGEYLCVK